MFLQIIGSTLPVPWYKENPVWGAIAGLCAVTLGAVTVVRIDPALARQILWADWPFVAMLFWCVLNGVTRNRRIRLYGRIAAMILAGLGIWRINATFLKDRPAKWLLVSCAVVKDNRVQEGRSVRLTLRGPTSIEATEWDD